MNIIENNPYRVLGVLSNSTRKEIERNKSQIKAFANVGRTPSFSFDFTDLLGTIDRTEDNLNDAINRLTFDKDKVVYGLFWFNNASSIDAEALKCLNEQGIEKAIDFLTLHGKANYSNYINLGILCLLSSKWTCAIYYYVSLFESTKIWDEYVQSITDDFQCLSVDEAIGTFVDYLIKSFPSVSWDKAFPNTFFNISTKTIECGDKLKMSKVYSVLVSKYIVTTTAELDELLLEAGNISKTDADANFNMAVQLEQSCRKLLATLKNLAEDDEHTYIRYADKVALQTLNNCIFYYNNDSENPNRPKKILRYVRFCMRIAESQMVKDRCKKNFEIIKEAYDNMCPQEIVEEVSFIEKQLNITIKDNTLFIYECLENLISNIKKALESIKQKIGENEKYYYAFSSETIYFVFNVIIPPINESVKAYEKANYDDAMEPLYYLRGLLEKCKRIAHLLDEFPKNKQEIISYYSKNITTLDNLYSEYTKIGKAEEKKQEKLHTNTTLNKKETTNKIVLSKKESIYESLKMTTKDNWIFGLTIALIVGLCTIFCIEISNAPALKEHPKDMISNKVNNDNIIGDVKEETIPYDVTYFKTGDMPYQDLFGKGEYNKKAKNCLEIYNNGKTDAVVFMETLDGRKIRHVYICKNEKYEMKHIPVGKYIVKIMYGNSWNSQKDKSGSPLGGFMENVSFAKSVKQYTIEKSLYSSGKYYHSIVIDISRDNKNIELISEEKFF